MTEMTDKRRPTHKELYDLCRDTLGNLRLMRQLERLPMAEQSTVIADGYDLFDRWNLIRGFNKL
jgi:hypothetical protein